MQTPGQGDRSEAGGTHTTPRSVDIGVAGLGVRIEAHDDLDLDLARRMLGSAPRGGEVSATVRFGAQLPPVPDRQPEFRGPYGDHWDDGGVHVFHHPWGFGAVVAGTEARLGGPASGHRRWVTVRNSMLFVLARIFDFYGRFVVHGAAIARPDRGTWLIVGESGRGKSTLAFAAHRAGWSVLADDMVVIDRGGSDDSDAPGDEVHAQGVPRVPSVPGDVAADVAGERLPDDDRDRVEIAAIDLDPRRLSLAGVIVADHSPAASARVVPISASSAAEALVPSLVLSALAPPVRRWFPVAMDLARGPVVRYSHGAVAARRLADAGAALEALPDPGPHGPPG